MRQHTLSVLVENSTSVLSQVTRLFSRKGYNIESLAVAPTEDECSSRITIITRSDDATVRQIVTQLKKLIPVISVKLMDKTNCVERELMMVKVQISNSAQRDEVIQLVNVFRANIVDFSKHSVIVAVTGNESKTGALLKLLTDFGILEIVRAGTIAMERGNSTILNNFGGEF